jgi:hypothetical protein
MKLGATLVLTLSLSFALITEARELIVVANTAQTDIVLKKRQVRDIFMGNDSQFRLKPVALAPNSDIRYVFNTKIVGLTESRIQSYWAQMRFSGRKKAPQEFESVESLLIFLQNNKDTVTYVPADTVIPDDLTVIYKSE